MLLMTIPQGDTPEAQGFLSVYLSNQTEAEVKARYEFTILDAAKNKQNRVKSTFTQFKAKPDSWGFRLTNHQKIRHFNNILFSGNSLTQTSLRTGHHPPSGFRMTASPSCAMCPS